MVLAAILLGSVRLDTSTINVFAAASLREAFISIANSYEHHHPGVKINFNFAGSQVLAAQINGGAPADVFASADLANLEKVPSDRASRVIFAENKLAVVTSLNFEIHSVKEIVRAERIVVADDSVPVGNYTNIFLEKAARSFGTAWVTDFKSKVVSKEQDVKSVLAKVKIGEADAGIVYVSDAVSAGKSVHAVSIPDSMTTFALYPAAVPSGAQNPAGGKDFIKYLLKASSQRILRAVGFLPPNHGQRVSFLKPANAIVVTAGG